MKAGTLAGVVAAGHLLPSVLSIPALRPVVSGRLAGKRVALTFDDGPDPRSTPLFLAELQRLQVPATFFVLGERVLRHPSLARRIAADGHQVGVHGWSHRPHLVRDPVAIAADLRRAQSAVVHTVGVRPSSWRPPHGVVTGAGLLTGAALGMSLTLWTADGADWAQTATPQSVLARIERRLSPGGIALLHDSDAKSAPGSWRTALAVLEPLAATVQARGWQWTRLDGTDEAQAHRHAAA